MLGDADELKMRFATGVQDHRILEACPRRSPTALAWTARRHATPVARATRREMVLGRLPQPAHDFAVVAISLL
jgi:hypothetical protein